LALEQAVEPLEAAHAHWIGADSLIRQNIDRQSTASNTGTSSRWRNFSIHTPAWATRHTQIRSGLAPVSSVQLLPLRPRQRANGASMLPQSEYRMTACNSAAAPLRPLAPHKKMAKVHSSVAAQNSGRNPAAHRLIPLPTLCCIQTSAYHRAVEIRFLQQIQKSRIFHPSTIMWTC